MKYLKRVWITVTTVPYVFAYVLAHCLREIWSGDTDDETWLWWWTE